MKKMFAMFVCALSFAGVAHASELEFSIPPQTIAVAGDSEVVTFEYPRCVADVMQATNSDYYYNWSKEEIVTALSTWNAFGHTDAVRATEHCNDVKGKL